MRASGVLVCLLSGGVAAIVACGDDGGANKLPDAPPGSDGALPDTPDPPTPARITITRDGSGVESVDVYFQNADNTLVAKVPTDANGVAEATVMPGAYVTVVNPFRVAFGGVPQDDVETIAGVQPGDQLQLTQNNGRQTLTNVNIVVDEDANGSQYKMWATCMVLDAKSSAGMPYYLSVGSGGERPAASPDMVDPCPKADILVESENGSGSGVGWIFKDDVAITASANIDITDAYTATPQVNVAYSDVPAAVTNLAVMNLLTTPDGVLWREQSNTDVVTGAASWSFERPNPAGSTQVFLTNMYGGGSYGQHQVIDWKPIADPATISFANALLREYTTTPTFDVATSSVTWMEAATGAIADLAIAEMTGFRSGATTLSWRWRLAGVPSGTTLKFPTLPADIAQYNVVTGDTTDVFSLTTAKLPGGYNSVRPVVLSIENPTVLIGGASGRIVIQQLPGRVVTRQAPSAPTGARAAARSR